MLRRKLLMGTALAVFALGLLLTLILISPRVTRPVIDPLRGLLLQATTSWISASINGAFEIGSLQGSLLGDPLLRDIVLRDSTGTVIGRIDTLRLDYAFKELFQGRLHIRALEIVDPQLNLSEIPDQGLNISHALSPTTPSEQDEDDSTRGLPLTISIDRVELLGGRTDLYLDALRGVRSVQDISLLLRGEITRQGVNFELQRLTAHAQPANVAIESARGGFLMHSGAIRFEELALHTAATHITLDGALPAQGRLADLGLEVQPLDVSEVGRLLADETLQNEVRLSLRAEGPGEALEVSGRLEAGGGRIELQGLVDRLASPPRYRAELDMAGLDMAAIIARPGLSSDLNAQVLLEGEGLRPEELEGELRLNIEASHLGDIALRPSQVHLQAQGQEVRIGSFDIDTSIARMTMQGGIDLSGASDLQYHLSAKLPDLHQLLDVERLGGTLELHGKALGVWPDLVAQGLIKAQNLRYDDYGVEVLDIDYTAKRLGGEPVIDSRWVAAKLDIDTFSVQKALILANYDMGLQSLSLDTRLQQSEKYQGQARGSLFIGDTGQRLLVEKLELQLEERVWAAQTPLELSLSPGHIGLKPFRFAHAEELIELSVDIRDRRFRDLNLQTHNLDLEFLKHVFNLPDTVSGRADLNVRVQGSFDDPVFEGDLEVTDISEQHLPFGEARLTLNYDERRLDGSLGLQQKNGEVLSLVLQQPLDLALTELPLEQRLMQGPVSARLELKQLDVSPFQASSDELVDLLVSIQTALQGFLIRQPEQFVVLPEDFPDFPDFPDLPEVDGPLQGIVEGRLDLSGTYAALNVDASLQIQDLGIENAIDQIRAPLTMSAKVEMADSLAELKQAIAEHRLAPAIDRLRLHTPVIVGRMPVQGTDGRLEIRDLLLQAEAALQPDGLRAELQGFQLQAQVPGLPVTDLALAASLSPKALKLSRLEVATPRSEVKAQGSIALPGQQLSLAVDIAPLMFDEFLPGLAPELPAKVQGRVDIKGTMKAPRAVVNLNYAAASIEAELDSQLAQSPPAYSAKLRIKDLDVARFSPGLAGKFKASARLQGTGFTEQDRRAKLSVNIDSPDFKLAPDMDLRMQGDIKGPDIVIEEFVLNSTLVQMVIQGLVSTREQTALIYNIDLGDLAPLQEFLGVNLHADGALSGEFRGTVNDLRTQGTLYLNDLRYGEVRGENLLGKFEATDLLSALAAKVDLELVGLQTPVLTRSSARIQGEYKEGRGEFSIVIGEGPFKESQLTGVLVQEAGYRLTLDPVRLQGDEWTWRNAAPVALKYDDSGGLELEPLRLQNDEQLIAAHGKLSPEGRVSAELGIENVKIRPVAQTFAPGLEIPYGRLSLDLVLNGTLEQPGVKGSMQIAGLKQGDESLGEISAELSSSGTVFNSDLRWTVQSEELVRVYGSVDTAEAGRIDMRMQSDRFDFARLRPLSSEIVKSAGSLEADLRLAGTLQRPQAFGKIEVRDGELQLLVTGEHYTDIRSVLRFEGTRAEIEELHVGSSTGNAVLRGWLKITGYEVSRLELTLESDDFTVMRTPAIDARVNADLALRGSQNDMSATGKIKVPQARIRIENLPTNEADDVEPWELTVSGVFGPGPGQGETADGKPLLPVKKAPLPFLRADIQIDFPRNVWVQGQGTAVELFGDVQVRKELQGPFFMGGYVETRRGFASFLGKRFEIETGRVDFTGAEEINPVLDITAKQPVSDYIVYVDVTGRSKKPELTFRSDPPLDQADVISLLVFGRTTDRLSGSEQGSLSGRAGQLAGSMVAGVLEGIVGNSLVDTIAIDEGTNERAGSVGVGRYITQDLFLSYDRSFRDSKQDNRGGNTVGLEYSINRNLKIEISSSDIGENAIDLNWSVDY